jgi:hypothetical protein
MEIQILPPNTDVYVVHLQQRNTDRWTSLKVVAPAGQPYESVVEATKKKLSQPKRPRPQVNRRLGEIVLGSQDDAEKVLDTLRILLHTYDTVTVGDYLELVGISPTFTDSRVGWTKLDNVPIKKVPKGFLLELPEPKSLVNH